MAAATRERLIAAARECLLTDGHANLSTRRVAAVAGVPLSQIHYHFGGRQGLILALLALQNEQLLERQQSMYGADAPLWQRYEQACTFLRDDLESGYVRMLQGMIAAGWNDEAIGAEVSRLLRGWFDLLERVVTEAADELGDLSPFNPRSVATLVGLGFVGGESMLLLGDAWTDDVFAALHTVGTLLKLDGKAPGSIREDARLAGSADRGPSVPGVTTRNVGRPGNRGRLPGHVEDKSSRDLS